MSYNKKKIDKIKERFHKGLNLSRVNQFYKD
uniref:Uncharacterized protein n=1 Tax=Rhizophora mucronata TaxID=61149 RepID=A0A2P2PMV8_RHIMU